MFSFFQLWQTLRTPGHDNEESASDSDGDCDTSSPLDQTMEFENLNQNEEDFGEVIDGGPAGNIQVPQQQWHCKCCRHSNVVPMTGEFFISYTPDVYFSSHCTTFSGTYDTCNYEMKWI